MRGFIVFVLCATAVYGAAVPVGSVHTPVVQKPVHDAQVPVVKPVEHEHPPVAILSQNAEVNPDGSHHNVWEGENGIKVTEEGTVKVLDETVVNSVIGEISYPDADGKIITLTYVADENGFQPKGDHLPTPPPVPLSVARALEYIAAHPYIDEDEKHVKYAKTQEAPVVEDAY